MKEKYLSFKLSKIVSGLNPSIDTLIECSNAYRIGSPKMKNLLCDFYLHNYVVTQDQDWYPLLYVGDIQLRAFMSWVQIEIIWGQQYNAYRKMESNIPLAIRVESRNPREIYREWHKILLRPSYGNRIMP